MDRIRIVGAVAGFVAAGCVALTAVAALLLMRQFQGGSEQLDALFAARDLTFGLAYLMLAPLAIAVWRYSGLHGPRIITATLVGVLGAVVVAATAFLDSITGGMPNAPDPTLVARIGQLAIAAWLIDFSLEVRRTGLFTRNHNWWGFLFGGTLAATTLLLLISYRPPATLAYLETASFAVWSTWTGVRLLRPDVVGKA